MIAASGSKGGGRVAITVGEDFGCGCDCWSRRSVVVRGWSYRQQMGAATTIDRGTTDVAVGGEEWLAATIEEESNTAMKKAGWKLLERGKGRAMW
ncbi:hypothetical protein GW17_00020243 [Ensete ventricosum]|nr:hypothetical protein GW17_00020243 [Ensete ventricosum]RZR99958.1 hypothetical protein BHM03_00029586 [Ensete ventricosum]